MFSGGPQALVDPDLAVVRGAAIQAGILEGSLKDEQEIVLTDVCPYTLGTAVLRRGMYEDQIVFDPLIPRNTTIPVEKTKIYYPSEAYQTEVLIRAYQGESGNLEHNEYLGEVRLAGIPPAPEGKEKIAVSFSYDMNGILQVAGKVVSTGKQVASEISTAGVDPKPPLDLEKWREAKDAKKYRPAVRKAEKYIRSNHYLTEDLLLSVNRLKEALLLEDEQEIAACFDMLMGLTEETSRRRLLPLMEEIAALTGDSSSMLQKSLAQVKLQARALALENEGFSLLIVDMFAALIKDCDCEECRMDMIAMEVTMLFEWQNYRREVLRLKTEFSDLYALHCDFFNEVLLGKNSERMIAKRRQEYNTLKKKLPVIIEDGEEEMDDMPAPQPVRRTEPKIGRNDPCPCGSGKKFKKCCGA